MEELQELKQRLLDERPAKWDELPDIPLYMDQVVGYLARQMITFDEGDNLTSAMINNYVKDGLLERANGKKYEEEHLAYLIAISALKRVMSVREMKALTAIGRERRNSDRQYEYFWKYLDESLNAVAERIDTEATDYDLPKLVLDLAMRSYAEGLACRRILAIMAERDGHGDMLAGKKK